MSVDGALNVAGISLEAEGSSGPSAGMLAGVVTAVAGRSRPYGGQWWEPAANARATLNLHIIHWERCSG